MQCMTIWRMSCREQALMTHERSAHHIHAACVLVDHHDTRAKAVGGHHLAAGVRHVAAHLCRHHLVRPRPVATSCPG